MEEILKDLLVKTKADRVIFYEMKRGKPVFGDNHLFKISPLGVYTREKASLTTSDKESMQIEYPYHLFMHVLSRTFSHGEMHFSLKTPTSLDGGDIESLKRALDDLQITKFSNFAVTENTFISLHWIEDNSPSEITRKKIKKELEELKKITTKYLFW